MFTSRLPRIQEYAILFMSSIGLARQLRFRVAKEEVMHMSNTELPSILLAIASLLFTLYFGLR